MEEHKVSWPLLVYRWWLLFSAVLMTIFFAVATIAFAWWREPLWFLLVLGELLFTLRFWYTDLIPDIRNGWLKR